MEEDLDIKTKLKYLLEFMHNLDQVTFVVIATT